VGSRTERDGIDSDWTAEFTAFGSPAELRQYTLEGVIVVPDVSVIEQFLHPPLGVLTREIIPGLASGSGVLTRPRGPVPVDAFGVTFTFFTVPAGYGYQLGNIREYDVRMLQLSVVHTLLDGHSIVSENFNVNSDNLPILWAVALPTQIQYYIAPGVQVQFWWLLAF
jgi:hypothetical protein